MVTVEFDKNAPADVKADVVAVFAAKGGDGPELGADAAGLGKALGIDLGKELGVMHFDGGLGDVARLATRGKAKAAALVVAGVGEADEATLESLRRAAGAAARAASKDTSLAIAVPGDLPADPEGKLDGAARAQVVAEGAGLGAYAYTDYRSDNTESPTLQRVLVMAGSKLPDREVKLGVSHGEAVARATSLTRDLVNTPPQDKRPPALAERISQAAKAAGLKAEVMDDRALAKGNFGGMIGVGQGSSEPPRLVKLSYEPARAKGHVVLAGKGITFDSGGLSLKPSSGMATMKCDMAGAGTVVGAMTALPALGVRTKVTGLLALAENMPSGSATRVSDVLTHRNGKTVEVMNTDAEGRLVLADALSYGAEDGPDAMIDIATLTGAQVVALGGKIAGLMGSDDELIDALENAADAAGEQVWHLPLPAEYASHLKSPVADMKNIGKAGQAGSLVAGLFLKEFTGDISWAHLDIAGPGFTEEPDGYYTSAGGTGMGVRTLVRYLQDRAAAG
jgi:leucyl aminopeptidase